MHKITNEKILRALSRLYQDASSDKLRMLKSFPKLLKFAFGKLKPEDVKEAYLAIIPEQGEFIFDLLVSENSQNIVEFGTSFGISTLYLAAAAKETGEHVITTEILPEKCAIARKNFEEAGVAALIEIREGNALDTLIFEMIRKNLNQKVCRARREKLH